MAHRISGFWVSLYSPICSLSLLFTTNKFSTNKIFSTSAVRVCLYFHSQSGLKNPEHLKFLRVSSVHQCQASSSPVVSYPSRCHLAFRSLFGVPPVVCHLALRSLLGQQLLWPARACPRTLTEDVRRCRKDNRQQTKHA
jgi:hypothetical protein